MVAGLVRAVKARLLILFLLPVVLKGMSSTSDVASEDPVLSSLVFSRCCMLRDGNFHTLSLKSRSVRGRSCYHTDLPPVLYACWHPFLFLSVCISLSVLMRLHLLLLLCGDIEQNPDPITSSHVWHVNSPWGTKMGCNAMDVTTGFIKSVSLYPRVYAYLGLAESDGQWFWCRCALPNFTDSFFDCDSVINTTLCIPDTASMATYPGCSADCWL